MFDDIAEQIAGLLDGDPSCSRLRSESVLWEARGEIARLRRCLRAMRAGPPPGWEAMPVGRLGIRKPAADSLRAAGVADLGGLVGLSVADLGGLRNFGITSLYQARDALADLGLAFRGDDLTRRRVPDHEAALFTR